MKKKFFGAMVVAAAMFSAYSAYNAQNEDELSSISANVEALANDETKPTGYAWSGTTDCEGAGNGDYEACIMNGSGNSCNNPGETTCDCGVNCI